MSYKAYDFLVLAALGLLGLAFVGAGALTTTAAFPINILGWGEVAVGILLSLLTISSIGFTATQPKEISCPHCGQKMTPKVKLGSGHLHLEK